MKKSTALAAALLCLALLAGCGTNVGVPNPDAPTIDENAPPTTDDETTSITTTQETTTVKTTEAPTTSTTRHFKDRDRPTNLLEYKMDENGIFYREDLGWLESIRKNPNHGIWGYNFGDEPSPSEHTVYATVQVKFRYGSKDWMIEMYKGRAGLVMLSSEICVSPEEELIFKLDVYQHNFLTGDTKRLFTRGPEKAWWYNGFVPGSFYEFNKKEEIIVVGSITFPDEDMLRAFEEPFAAAGFKKGKPGRDKPEEYSVNGNTLTFSWQYIDQG